MAAFGAKHWDNGPVCIDELVTVLAEYPTDVRWNGWLCPFMDPVAVNKVMAAIQSEDSDQPSPTHEWRDDGVLIVTEYDGDTAYPEEMPPNEDGLYPLGAYAWVWSEDTYVTDPEILTMLGTPLFEVVSDNSNHNLPIGAQIRRLTADELDESWQDGDWYTQDNPESAVSIDPRDLKEI